MDDRYKELAMSLLAHTSFPPISPPIPGERSPRLLEALPKLQSVAKRESPRVAIKVKGRILFLNLGEVVSVQADGNYVLLQRESTSYPLRESISAVAEKLEPHGFIRIHRSVLVNSTFVEEITPYSSGEYGLRMKGKREYRVTRTYKKNLKLLAEFWIGAGGLFLD
jgi:two-component system LytT family response regulator